jgi:hypothetical protein
MDLLTAYADSPMTEARTRRLATRCFVCNTDLCDAVSVELGIGPTCRKRLGLIAKDKNPRREYVNELTAQAALLAEDGRVLEVIALADEIGSLGYPKVAEAVRKRFVDITVTLVGDALHVKTPYSDAWNRINWEWRLGQWNRDLKVRVVQPTRIGDLYEGLRYAYAGKQAVGPDGQVFTIQAPARRVAA